MLIVIQDCIAVLIVLLMEIVIYNFNFYLIFLGMLVHLRETQKIMMHYTIGH